MTTVQTTASEMDTASGVKSAHRAMAVLSLLGSLDHPVPATAIAQQCGLPRSSAYQLLETLRRRNFVIHFPAERAWGLGPAALEIGSSYIRTTSLERYGDPVVRRLAAETAETSHLAVLREGDVVYLIRHQATDLGTNLVSARGVSIPAHLTAVGKAMLMHLPASELVTMFPADRPVAGRTGRGPQSVAELQDELRASRARGWALDDQATTPGVTCVAAPVLGADGYPLAAIGVTYLKRRNDRTLSASLAARVVASARRLSATLGWHARDP